MWKRAAALLLCLLCIRILRGRRIKFRVCHICYFKFIISRCIRIYCYSLINRLSFHLQFMKSKFCTY